MEKNSFTKIIKLFCILFCILIIFLIFYKIRRDTDPTIIQENKKNELFSKIITTNEAKISAFSVYGTYFNLSGNIEIPKISGIGIEYVDVLITNLKDYDNIIKSTFTYSNGKLTFSSSDKINSGLNLEEMTEGKYYILLKVTFSNSDVKYYALSNDSEYKNLNYSTISSNYDINIDFNTYNAKSYLEMNVVKIQNKPNGVYDIALEVTSSNKDEAEQLLNLVLELKAKLENLGLKVFIAHTDIKDILKDTEATIYNDNGKITLINESKAKLMLSFQINHNSSKENGMEIYTASNINYDFANLIVKNITNSGNVNVSSSEKFNIAEGVYTRTFTNADISSFKARAEKVGYEPYLLTTSTTYFYIIREIGGISTKAFVDGRNKVYNANKYYNSNIRY